MNLECANGGAKDSGKPQSFAFMKYLYAGLSSVSIYRADSLFFYRSTPTYIHVQVKKVRCRSISLELVELSWLGQSDWVKAGVKG